MKQDPVQRPVCFPVVMLCFRLHFFSFSWFFGDSVEYCSILASTSTLFVLFIGLLWVWVGAIGSDSKPQEKILGIVSSRIFVVAFAVMKKYPGWGLCRKIRIVNASVFLDVLS